MEKIIKDNIAKGIKFDFELTKQMQLDVRDEFVAETIPALLARLTHLREIWSSPETEAIFAKLQHWDFVMHKDSI